MKAKKLVQFDWAIKTLLRRKANFPILEGFLSELLGTDVTINSLLESESNKSHAKDKSNRVDVLAQLSNGERVIIEVQCEREWDFISRMLYGASKVVVEHLQEGDPYGMIPRVISVNIVYFDLGHGEDYIYHGTTDFRGIHKKDILQLKESEKKNYPSHVDRVGDIFPEYYVLKVSGFDLKIKDTLDEWVYALKESEVKPEFKAKGIHEAGHALALLNLSDDERFAYDRHIGDMRISKSTAQTYFGDGLDEGMARGMAQGIAQGMAQGIAQGLTQGEAKGKAEVVLHMHGLGLPADEIAKLAKLSQEQVKEILEANSVSFS